MPSSGWGTSPKPRCCPRLPTRGRNSELAALVSDDPEISSNELAERHQVPHRFHDFDACLASGEIEAVYIALPNHLHCEYTVRAAEAGIHVLCEKPMAVTAAECEKMNHAVEAAGVKLMLAYRLHFEEANLRAIKIAHSPASWASCGPSIRFSASMSRRETSVCEGALGGGTLYDIGVYCINAARYLFRDEPLEVTAFSANNGDPRFAETDEMTGATLRFPLDRLAVFLVSFGTSGVGLVPALGTEGELAGRSSLRLRRGS